MRSSNIALICLLACCSAMGAGCGTKKSSITGPEPVSGYPALTSPVNVLAAMISAYAKRDTVELNLVYDDAYQGTSYDEDDWGTATLSFTKADEVQHVAALARTPSITRVSVSFNPLIRRYTDAADPAGWASIENPIRSVQIDDGETTYDVYLSYETLIYKFIPTTPDTTSPTDTTWKIVGWSEVEY